MDNIKSIIFVSLFFLFTSCRKDPQIDLTNPNDDSLENVINLIDATSQWKYRYYWGDGNPEVGMELICIDTVEYFFDGDTILERNTKFNYNEVSTPESYNYMKLKFKMKRTQLNPWPGGDTYSEGIMACVRVDSSTKRIFFTHGDQNNIAGLDPNYEAILYDLNLEVGDTLPYNYWLHGSFVVKEIETLKIGSHHLNVMKIYDNGNYYLGRIIEGVGGFEGLERRHFDWDAKLIQYSNQDFSYTP